MLEIEDELSRTADRKRLHEATRSAPDVKMRRPSRSRAVAPAISRSLNSTIGLVAAPCPTSAEENPHGAQAAATETPTMASTRIVSVDAASARRPLATQASQRPSSKGALSRVSRGPLVSGSVAGVCSCVGSAVIVNDEFMGRSGT